MQYMLLELGFGTNYCKIKNTRRLFSYLMALYRESFSMFVLNSSDSNFFYRNSLITFSEASMNVGVWLFLSLLKTGPS